MNRHMNRLETLERLFKALADPTRLRVISLLMQGEVCVCHLHESLQIPQPKTSRHLAYLKRAGLVADRKSGQWVYYRLSEPANELVGTLMAAVTHCLTHVSTIDQDVRRLSRTTGRVTRRLHGRPSLTCCAR